MALHLAAIGMRRVSAAGQNSDIGKAVPLIFEGLSQSPKRLQKVSPDVVVKRFQGRNVEDAGVSDGQFLGDQLIDRPEEGCQGFAATGRRGD